MKNIITALCLFVGATAVGFLVTAPSVAVSETRTVHGAACFQVTNTILRCSMPIGTTMQSGTLSSAYFDYTTYASQTVVVAMYKYSYTGASYADYKYITCNGTCDSYLPAVNIKAASSVFDYLLGQIAFGQPSTIIGMTINSN